MPSLGAHLRDLRERRGVSLDEISRTTRVARSYLEALEAGDFAKLPAPVFTRGFIRAYCQVLGESPADALARFNEQARDGGDDSPPPYERHPRTPSRTRGSLMVSFVLLVVLGAALLAVTLTLRSGRDASQSRPAVTKAEPQPPKAERPAPSPPADTPAVTTDSTPPAPSVPAGPGPTPASVQPPPAAGTGPASTPVAPERRPDPAANAATTERPGSSTVPAARPPERPATVASPVRPPERPAATTAPSAPAPTPVATSPARDAERIAASATAPYRLIARASEPTWVRVRTEDGRHLSEETIPAGQVREWVSNRRFSVVVGNAAGVRLELNGVTLPALGPSRGVVELSLPPQAQ